MKKMIYGVSIFKKSNKNCQYLHVFPKSVESDVCTCPYAKVYMEANHHTMILNCPNNIDECPLRKGQNEADIRIIRKYIDKYGEDGWVLMPIKHYNILLENKLSLNDEKYIQYLFNYFGYHKVNDDKISDDTIVFTNVKISEQVAV